jgi:ligand-binding sensor domain-containing protein
MEMNPVTGLVFRSVTPMRGRNVTALQFDADSGDLWVGTDQGLFLINPFNGAIKEQITDLPSGNILSLSANTGNKLWVGTSEGLAWVSRNRNEARSHWTFTRPEQ